MKKFLVILMLIVSAAVFGQEAKEDVFDLSDDVLTENEKNCLDFYNNHWPKERESAKKMLVEMMDLFDGLEKRDAYAEEFRPIFSEIVYGDEFLVMAELWQEGFIPNFSAMAALCNICLIANDDLSDQTIVKGYKILKKYCEEEREFPVTLGTSLYHDIYK
ncbi:MAG: hypothetical protein SOZ27_01025 [Spirochaetia bacterium]|nr:hypothetical protein [Spirochaetia bacterium]